MVPQLLTMASWDSPNPTPAALNVTPPIAERLSMMDDEDALVTSVVAIILIGMVLAYMFLCCHVWGIHLRLLHLLKCVNVRNDSGRVFRRPSISLPLRVTQSPAQAASGAPPTRPPRYCTPPPRYSDAVDSLPSYSCALKREIHKFLQKSTETFYHKLNDE
ncbi:uncharacterized protein [Panulirus ornatus]|uniref:uncharacterized protein isoform X2 n=1 Tax=Panulirus ornatus TaxID=150431 RepID=UPI003A843431